MGHQMTMILQPISDQVQELDEQMAQLLEGLRSTDTNVAQLQKSLDGNVSETTKLKDELCTTNLHLSMAHQALTEASERDEMLQQGMEMANAFSHRLQERIEGCAGAVPELERNVSDFDCQFQALKANVQRVSDSLVTDVRRGLEQLGSDMDDLKSDQLKTCADLGRLRSDFGEHQEHLQDTRQLVDKTSMETATLTKSFGGVTSREDQLGARLNDWKHQWSKLQPKLEVITKETAQLKQLTERHEGTLCNLQQGYATNLGGIETLQKQHVQTTFDLQALQQHLTGTQRDLSDTREGLRRADNFASTLQATMQKTDNELRRTTLKLDGLDTKHSSLCDTFEKTNGCVADLSKEHRKSISNMQNLKHELEKTNDTLSSARNQLEATDNNLSGLKGEVVRTNEVVHRLDQGVELCQASFAGLQKGFVETGAHASRRPSMLPKLGQDVDLKRPDSATESTTSRVSSRRSSTMSSNME